MRKLFGTDGVRGVANLEPMNSETALKLGRAAAYVFKGRVGRHQIVIGKDTRLSGYMLESALTSGICSMGVDVLMAGPILRNRSEVMPKYNPPTRRNIIRPVFQPIRRTNRLGRQNKNLAPQPSPVSVISHQKPRPRQQRSQ